MQTEQAQFYQHLAAHLTPEDRNVMDQTFNQAAANEQAAQQQLAAFQQQQQAAAAAAAAQMGSSQQPNANGGT